MPGIKKVPVIKVQKTVVGTNFETELETENTGLGMVGGKQMSKDVDCYSSCNQLKINEVWATKSNNGWKNEGWTNKDDPQGTGDHESYE